MVENYIYTINTFSFFFSKFINNLCLDDLNLSENEFKALISSKINNLYSSFIILFDKFNLNHVKLF